MPGAAQRTLNVAITGEARRFGAAADEANRSLQNVAAGADRAEGSTRRMGAGFAKFGRALEKDVGVRVDKLGGGLSLLSMFIGGPLGAALTAGAFAFDTLGTALGIVSIANIKAAASWTAHKVAMVASTVATRTATAAQWLLNIALTANPIALVILALAALVAAIIITYKRSETFRRIVSAAFNAIKAAGAAVLGFFRRNWPLLIGIIAGPIGVIVALVIRNWSTIQSIIAGAWRRIRSVTSSAWSGIRSAVSSAIGGLVRVVASIPGRVVAAIGNLAGLLYAKGRDLIQGLINGILSKAGDVGSAIGNIASKIGSFLPGSPVKEGPLTVLNRGRAGGQIVEMLAGGITAATPRVAGPTSQLAGRSLSSVAPAGISPRELARAVRAALDGMTLEIDDRRGRLVARDAALLARAG